MAQKRVVRRELDDVRVGDLSTFLLVQRMGSLSAAAREMRVTPSQVSKAIRRLEQQFDVQLLARSSHGVTLTNAAVRSVPELEELLERLTRTWSPSEGRDELTLAATAYLSKELVPKLVTRAPALRVRTLIFAPTFIRAVAPQNVFDAALALGPLDLPSGWSVQELGPAPMHLFGSRGLVTSLGSRPISPERVRELRFVMPVLFHNNQFIPYDDGCPLPPRDRLRGHETQAVELGLELVAHTDQVAFVPDFAAKSYVASGALMPIEVEGWDVRKPISFACHVDRVSAPLRKLIAQVVGEVVGSGA